MDEIDKLLAGIENGRISQPLRPTSSIDPLDVKISIDDLLGGLNESAKHDVREQLSRPSGPKVAPVNLMDELLAQVKLEQEQHAEVELVRQKDLEAEEARQSGLKAQRLEKLRVRRREELGSMAQEWLATLSVKSEEGRWFEEFACNYESRLEAAIDYLEALQEVSGLLPRH